MLLEKRAGTIGCAPSPPNLILPENQSTASPTPTLQWSATSPLDNFRLEVDNDPDFSSPTDNLAFDNTVTYWTKMPGYPEDNYYWRVWAINRFGASCSAVWVFTVKPLPPTQPLLLFPVNGGSDWTVVKLSWRRGERADNHRLEVSTDPEFHTLKSFLLQPPNDNSRTVYLDGPGIYYWRVWALNQFGENCSDTWCFRAYLASLRPSFPPDGFITNSPLVALAWENRTPVDNFELQVDNDYDFSSPVLCLSLLENTYQASLPDGGYYWRVRAFRLGENSPWSDVWKFKVDTVRPSPPTPLFPLSQGKTNDNTPLFRWGAPLENSLPLNYCVQVSPDRYQIFVSTWTDSENWECPSELSDGLWYWRACARDNAGNTGLFFDWIPFTVDTVNPSPPPLLSPVPWADIDGTLVEFEWGEGSDDRTGIKGYFLQLSADPSFLSLENECFLTQHQFLYFFPSFGDWYWRVGSVDGAGNVGWSAGRGLTCRGWRELDSVRAGVSAPGLWRRLDGVDGYAETLCQWREVEILTLEASALPRWMVLQTWRNNLWGESRWRLEEGITTKLLSPIPVPIILLPENSAHLSRVRLCWENSKAADYFEIQTDTPSEFWRPFRFTYKTWFSTENFFDLPLGNLTDGDYLWRVRAWRSGSASPWSEVYTFVLDRSVSTPAPILPSDNLNLGRTLVTFTWSEVQDVTPPVQYEVQVSSSRDFTSYTSSGWLSWRTWDTELGEGLYFWRVRARDNLGNLSAPSAPRSFRVDLTSPAAPRLLGPPTGAWLTSTSINLSWETVEDESPPVTYLVFVDDAADFSSPNLAVQTTANSLSVTVADGTWYWRVIAADNAGNRSSPSSASFRVDSTPPAIPAQVAPPSLLTSGLVKFEWSSVEDLNGVYYDFMVEGVVERENLRENSFQLSLLPGTYVWRVRSRDGLGNTRGWSGPSSFEIRDVQPPSLLLLEPVPEVVEEDFTLRLKIEDDFGIDENRISVKMDGQEKGFVLAGDLLTSEFKNLSTGKHLIEVLVSDAENNENSLSLKISVVPRVLAELSAKRTKLGEPLALDLRLRNRSENQVSKRYALALAGQVKELKISLNPGEEVSVPVEFETRGLGTECVVELLDLDTGARTSVPVHLATGFPFLTLPIAFAAAVGFWLRIRRPKVIAPAETREEEEKFPLPLPAPAREPDDYSTLTSLFRPELQTPFTKEWSRLTKRYEGQLSPLMEEYARLLREGPAPRLIERYRGMVRGRRG
jgi:hypothetical protein